MITKIQYSHFGHRKPIHMTTMPAKYLSTTSLAIIIVKILARTGRTAFPVSRIVAQGALGKCPRGFAIHELILPIWI
jgi:hypothetical protein